MKAWQRQWKIRRIEETNPKWEDLFDHILEASFGFRRGSTPYGCQPPLA
jgi:hypothetical protein